MKMYLVALTLFVLAGVIRSEERVQIADWKDTTVRAGGFANETELRSWATNCLGGGTVQELILGGRQFFVSTRRFTSGAPDTEVCFWSDSWESEKLQPFLIIPSQAKDIRIEATKKGIEVKAFSKKEKGFETIAVVLKGMLPLHSHP